LYPVPIASSKLMSIELETPTVVDKSAKDRDVIVVIVQSLRTVSVKLKELSQFEFVLGLIYCTVLLPVTVYTPNAATWLV